MSTVTAISGNGSIVSLIVEDVGDEGHVDEARPRGDVGPEVMEMHRYGVRGAIAGDITERLSLFATLRYHEEDGPKPPRGPRPPEFQDPRRHPHTTRSSAT